MAETGIHVTLIAFFLAMLRTFFRRRNDVYVGANMFLYYREDNPNKRLAPDLFVVFGVPNKERRTWRIWEEGKAPDVVFEFTSRSTWDEDLGSKKGLYEFTFIRYQQDQTTSASDGIGRGLGTRNFRPSLPRDRTGSVKR